jgi:hypothetical protein
LCFPQISSTKEPRCNACKRHFKEEKKDRNGLYDKCNFCWKALNRDGVRLSLFISFPH